MSEADSELNQELTEAFDDPDGFDFGFEEKRAEINFANFGFDPNKALELQEAEMERIYQEHGMGGVIATINGYLERQK